MVDSARLVVFHAMPPAVKGPSRYTLARSFFLSSFQLLFFHNASKNACLQLPLTGRLCSYNRRQRLYSSWVILRPQSIYVRALSDLSPIGRFGVWASGHNRSTMRESCMTYVAFRMGPAIKMNLEMELEAENGTH